MVALQVIDPVTQQQSQTTPPTATVSPIMAPAPPPAMGPLTRERRRKAHGLYFHSSPPKVLQMNNQNLQRDNDGRAREVIKPSNIRIWLHQKQLAKLTKVIWTGQGMRLRTETSHHPKMKRFLECVPHVMGVIKDIHQAVVDNDPETLREKMADPTPRIVLTSKDSNGLTPLHKAAGLAHTQIVEYILSIWPSLSSDEDHTGKTPLHWAASAKNNARSFNLLVQAGADEAALDHKGKLAEYYKNKPSDIDRSLLTVIPEAPRISQQGFPSHFDWSMFTIDADTDDAAVPIQEVIDRGDMEQLAVIVLSGSGGKLLGRRADLPEIQAFLDNVPSYMNKIRRVHMAAREGSLRELQSALDRRKFATAKDQISPHGATPLHVATIFGQSGIVRYLAGRFPETMTATDDNGRTPLHYAATLKDNGHFYNLLTHLGANSKAEDNLNHPAEFYLDHEGTKDLLSHRQLLLDYGAEEDLADEMLNDQVPDDQHSARRELDDVDTLTTLERCFKIIHEPVDGVIRKLELPSNSVPGSASSLRILITSYLARFLKRSVFDKIKKRQTRLDHNLFDVIWPAMKKATKERKIDEDLNVGIVIPDYDVFVVFQEFLVPLLKDMHCMDLQQELVPHPQMQYFPRYVIAESPNHTQEGNGNILRENPDDIKLNLDTSGKFITGTVIECSRNLEDYEFPINLSIAQLEKAERILTSKILSMAFAHAIGEEELGTYYTMNEILESPSEIRTILATSGLLIPMLDHFDPYQIAESIALNGRFWPYGRGVYVSHKQDLAAWINAQEHLRVLCCSSSQSPADVGSVYSKIGRVMNFLEDKIQFKHSYFLGYLVSRPSFLGTGLKITLSLELPHLRKERENLRHLCVVRGLHLITEEDETCVRMSNMRSLAQCEWQIFQDYTTAITNIVALEKELSMTNSLHIAATLLKIFQLSNSQVEIPLFRTEEGRYLATSLGDPLIKGLTEVANKRPADPITYLANYLFNFANQNQGQLPATGGNKTSAGADRSADQKQDLNNNRNSIEFGVQEDTEEELESSVNKIGPKPLANGMMAAAKPLDDPEQEQGELSPDIAPSSENRDEHGQSMLHFACARSHGRNALIQLIEESGVSLTYRDELYRTARDVSLQASQPDNAKEIDRYVLGLAARGDLDGLNAMLLDGYDHIVDVAGSDGTTIMQVASTRGHREIVRFLETARDFEEKRETLLTAIREKNSPKVMELLEQPDGAKLAKAKNYYGRCSLHIAVLMENEDLVDFLASRFKSTLKVGDNLERTALHYAMGIGNVEAISRILIKNGAKRVLKDLKGRQPSYYFMNKADILRLQEEEKE
ncbi:uncharacterized protein LOC129741846 isoform X9 [Uranotaenia lowii]|uniref:uncharacterized protein LOC129741846 isoform X9 n=1 Tax=Uranotaenia lowii TaxID=190385 RepID=UPI00247979EA|nr:uncharacterized protein LOC129741846 isoform X9 [Uranotaenia lowii]